MKANIMTTKKTSSATCSTSEAALALGISVRTAQLWVEEGRLQAWKTPGGHRRILRTSIDRIVDQQQSAGRPSGTVLSILILEAESPQRERLRSLLIDQFPNCAVTVSDSAFAGLLRIGEYAPDILITDLGMVGIDNFRMLETVDCSPQLRGLLIVVLAEDKEMMQLARRRLPPEFALLSKPVDHDELLRLIRAYVQGRQTIRRQA